MDGVGRATQEAKAEVGMGVEFQAFLRYHPHLNPPPSRGGELNFEIGSSYNYYRFMIGKILIFTGIVLVIAGLAINYAPWLINWFGKLPGDIHIKGEHGNLYIPITSMIIVSVVLTIIINLFFRR